MLSFHFLDITVSEQSPLLIHPPDFTSLCKSSYIFLHLQDDIDIDLNLVPLFNIMPWSCLIFVWNDSIPQSPCESDCFPVWRYWEVVHPQEVGHNEKHIFSLLWVRPSVRILRSQPFPCSLWFLTMRGMVGSATHSPTLPDLGLELPGLC